MRAFILRSLSYGLSIWCCALSGIGHAQSPQVIRFDSGRSDNSGSAVTDAQGNLYVAAHIEDPTKVSPFAVLKYSRNGELVWRAHYGGPQAGGQASAVAVDALGNVYAAGYAYVPSNQIGVSNIDWLVVKFSPDGVQLWSHLLNGPVGGFDSASVLQLDSGGNLYAGGRSDAVGGLGMHFIKYASDGRILWERSDGRAGTANGGISDMQLDRSGNLVAVGSVGSFTPVVGSAALDVLVVKYDSDGNRLWSSSFTESDHSIEFATDLDVDSRGTIYVTVDTQTDTSGEVPNIPLALVFDTNGTLLRSVRGPDAGGARVRVDAFDNVVFTGATNGTGPFDPFPDFHTQTTAAKFDAAGNRLWSVDLTRTPLTDRFYPRFIAAARGSLILSGELGTLGASDWLTVKLDDSTGAFQFSHRFDGVTSGSDAPTAIQSDAFENVLVVGTTRGRQGSSFDDIVTLKFLDGATPPPDPVTAPSAPSSLTATAPSASRIALAWQDTSSNESGFVVERCSGATCTSFAQLAQLGANATSYIDTSTVKNASYRYRVRAQNAVGSSAYSNIASVKTPKK